MIRFMPDSPWDLLWRPVDMVSPESGLYVEFMAPDLRLLAALGLGLLVLAVMLLRRGTGLSRPVAWLLGSTVLAYLLWMGTSGNGRYFIPFLVLLGPLCIALARRLPGTPGFKVAIILILVAMQGYLLVARPPWRFMSWLPWHDTPYFQTAVPADPPSTTYVMVEMHPYSLIAPRFAADARWVRLPSLAGPREHALTQRFLQASQGLRLLVPAVLDEGVDNRQPSGEHARILERMLKPHGLALLSPAACNFLPSVDLARAITRQEPDEQMLAQGGFWSCPLRFDPVAAPRPVAPVPDGDTRIEAALDAAERLCPRFFPNGQAITRRVGQGGYVRNYPGTDSRLYFIEPGTLAYRFWMSLNPTVIGSADAVLKGEVTLDCRRIRSPNWRTGAF